MIIDSNLYDNDFIKLFSWSCSFFMHHYSQPLARWYTLSVKTSVDPLQLVGHVVQMTAILKNKRRTKRRQERTLPWYDRGGSRIFFRRGCTRLLLASIPINHIVFCFLQNTSCITKPQVISGEEGGGGAHPLRPPPRSAHVWALHLACASTPGQLYSWDCNLGITSQFLSVFPHLFLPRRAL